MAPAADGSRALDPGFQLGDVMRWLHSASGVGLLGAASVILLWGTGWFQASTAAPGQSRPRQDAVIGALRGIEERTGARLVLPVPSTVAEADLAAAIGTGGVEAYATAIHGSLWRHGTITGVQMPRRFQGLGHLSLTERSAAVMELLRGVPGPAIQQMELGNTVIDSASMEQFLGRLRQFAPYAVPSYPETRVLPETPDPAAPNLTPEEEATRLRWVRDFNRKMAAWARLPRALGATLGIELVVDVSVPGVECPPVLVSGGPSGGGSVRHWVEEPKGVLRPAGIPPQILDAMKNRALQEGQP